MLNKIRSLAIWFVLQVICSKACLETLSVNCTTCRREADPLLFWVPLNHFLANPHVWLLVSQVYYLWQCALKAQSRITTFRTQDHKNSRVGRWLVKSIVGEAMLSSGLIKLMLAITRGSQNTAPPVRYQYATVVLAIEVALVVTCVLKCCKTVSFKIIILF